MSLKVAKAPFAQNVRNIVSDVIVMSNERSFKMRETTETRSFSKLANSENMWKRINTFSKSAYNFLSKLITVANT